MPMPENYDQPFADQLLQHHAEHFILPEILKIIRGRPFFRHSLSRAEQGSIAAEIDDLVQVAYRNHFNPEARVRADFQLLTSEYAWRQDSMRRHGWIAFGTMPGRDGIDTLMIRFSVTG